MIYQNVEFHGFAEAIADEKYPEAVNLQRVPESIRPALNPNAQSQVLTVASNEIRFVADSKVAITLSALQGGVNAVVFWGNFQGNVISITEEPTTFKLEIPARLKELPEEYLAGNSFSTNVIRLVLSGGQIRFHQIQGDNVRPPKAEECPALRYLSYGTSITHGAGASLPHLAYVSQVATRLGADLINLGLGGACHCENEIADFIAESDEWDFASLAVSVNMIGARYSLDEFYSRVAYLIDKVAGSNPKRPVFCVTIYPHFRDWTMLDNNQNPLQGSVEDYRQQLRNAVNNCNHKNVYLFEGPEILQNMTGLTPDLIHPADNGMIQMGENLANLMTPILRDYGLLT